MSTSTNEVQIIEIASDKADVKKVPARASSSGKTLAVVVLLIMAASVLAVYYGARFHVADGGAAQGQSSSGDADKEEAKEEAKDEDTSDAPTTANAAKVNTVIGTWVSNWGASVAITADTWYSAASWGNSVYEIDKIDSTYLVAQNSEHDAYNAELWSRFDYHWYSSADDTWGYCTTKYDLASSTLADESDVSELYNPSDSAAGCNGFGHTTMAPLANPFKGSWMIQGDWGGPFTVTDTIIKTGNMEFTIEAYGTDFILAHNTVNEWNPNLWSLFRFATYDGVLGYCQIVYNGASAIDAFMTDISATSNSTYDAEDGANGCNNFPPSFIVAA